MIFHWSNIEYKTLFYRLRDFHAQEVRNLDRCFDQLAILELRHIFWRSFLCQPLHYSVQIVFSVHDQRYISQIKPLNAFVSCMFRKHFKHNASIVPTLCLRFLRIFLDLYWKPAVFLIFQPSRYMRKVCLSIFFRQYPFHIICLTL